MHTQIYTYIRKRMQTLPWNEQNEEDEDDNDDIRTKIGRHHETTALSFISLVDTYTDRELDHGIVYLVYRDTFLSHSSFSSILDQEAKNRCFVSRTPSRAVVSGD